MALNLPATVTAIKPTQSSQRRRTPRDYLIQNLKAQIIHSDPTLKAEHKKRLPASSVTIDDQGQFVLEVKYRKHPIELGLDHDPKVTQLTGPAADLKKTIKSLIDAAKSGHFDEILERQRAKYPLPTSRDDVATDDDLE